MCSSDLPGTFDRPPLGPQYLTLVCSSRKLQEGLRRIGLSDGPVPKAGIGPGLGPVWACAQGRHEAGPRARMGQGSRCRTVIKFKFLSTYKL